MRKTIFLIKSPLVLIVLIFFFGCSRTTIVNVNVPLYEIPADWQNDSIRTNTVLNYSKYLSGKKIFLDPGHGGEDRKNKNSRGDVIEADVNLRVALNLKSYLERAGVTVFISRDKDTTVQLRYRSELANKSGADLFISIHHNAPGKTEDVSTDYTSVYYHAKNINYEYEPCNQDIARYIARDLSYVMRTSTGLGSFDGSYSDYNIYPGEGFSVLRKTKIPAILVENAFHTSRLEELRLNNEEFNRIQAWGIFRGIARYYKAGIPQIELITDSIKIINNSLRVVFALKDSSGIDPKSIRFFFNKDEMNSSFDKINNLISVQIDSVKDGDYPVRIIAANKNGNYALPFSRMIKISGVDVKIE
jgi:N-acetylmuramoyl-L-alanine amidase